MSNDAQTGFDAEYVKKLREEAASWRTKYRELESQNAFVKVEAELVKRNVKADPQWVTIEEGQAIGEAVDKFVESYPHLVQASNTPAPPSTNTPTVIKPTAPKPMVAGQPNTNTPGPTPNSVFGKNDVHEIKKDPVARAKLRDHYRQLLAQTSNQIDGANY